MWLLYAFFTFPLQNPDLKYLTQMDPFKQYIFRNGRACGEGEWDTDFYFQKLAFLLMRQHCTKIFLKNNNNFWVNLTMFV